MRFGELARVNQLRIERVLKLRIFIFISFCQTLHEPLSGFRKGIWLS